MLHTIHIKWIKNTVKALFFKDFRAKKTTFADLEKNRFKNKLWQK
jgi:hypothetical protein